MEPKMNQIKDIEKARVGAHAEKPLRDIARQEDLNLTGGQKETLDQVAEKLGEVAMDKYEKELPQTTNEAKDESKEGKETLEQMRVNKMIELIEKNPDIDFCVSANGSLSATSVADKKYGQYEYWFNKKIGKIEEVSHSVNRHRGASLDFATFKFPRLQNFEPAWKFYKKEGKGEYRDRSLMRGMLHYKR